MSLRARRGPPCSRPPPPRWSSSRPEGAAAPPGAEPERRGVARERPVLARRNELKEPAPARARAAGAGAKEEPSPSPSRRSSCPAARRQRMKMVELNAPESKTIPDNARFLSTRTAPVRQGDPGRYTNLETGSSETRALQRAETPARPSSRRKENRIAETREQKLLQEGRRLKDRSAGESVAADADGASDLTEAERKQIEGLAQTALRRGSALAQQAREQAKRRRGLALGLDHRSHDRIDGQAAVQAREQARLSPSKPSNTKGRYERKWQAVRAALENFIPEVQPGNQTALTRGPTPSRSTSLACIDRSTGSGLRVSRGHGPQARQQPDERDEPLDDGGDQRAANATVGKTTIVRAEWLLTFDVAALDAALSAGPYPPTPRRSARLTESLPALEVPPRPPAVRHLSASTPSS